jgi:hypothetical protein
MVEIFLFIKWITQHLIQHRKSHAGHETITFNLAQTRGRADEATPVNLTKLLSPIAVAGPHPSQN